MTCHPCELLEIWRWRCCKDTMNNFINQFNTTEETCPSQFTFPVSSEHIFGHTKPNKPHPSVVGCGLVGLINRIKHDLLQTQVLVLQLNFLNY